MHTHMSSSYRWFRLTYVTVVSFCVGLCHSLTRISLFIIWSVVLCYVYYLAVIWLSVPAKSIAWKV